MGKQARYRDGLRVIDSHRKHAVELLDRPENAIPFC